MGLSEDITKIYLLSSGTSGMGGMGGSVSGIGGSSSGIGGNPSGYSAGNSGGAGPAGTSSGGRHSAYNISGFIFNNYRRSKEQY